MDLKGMSIAELQKAASDIQQELHFRIAGDPRERVTVPVHGVTTDRNDPDLGHGTTDAPGPQNKKHLVLSEEERAKGFVRPVRQSYRHVGIAGPQHPLRDLTSQEKELWGYAGYVKFEEYPKGGSSTGRMWTQEQLDSVGKGCGAVTTMGIAIAETYASQPHFYGSTFCCGCGMYRPVGEDGEFVWDGTSERVGT